MGILPKPEKKSDQILVFISGIFVAILAFAYFMSQIDLMPDGIGPLGYLDDLIVLLLLIFFAYKFVKRVGARVSRNKEAYKELWRSGGLWKIMTSPKTWLKLIILGLAIAYFVWSLDVIPDLILGIGYVDDAIVAIGAALALISFYARK